MLHHRDFSVAASQLARNDIAWRRAMSKRMSFRTPVGGEKSLNGCWKKCETVAKEALFASYKASSCYITGISRRRFAARSK